jgi:PIN domain
MPTSYVLVDFENVQPDLSTLAGTAYKVKVFFGAKQQEGRVSFKLLDAMLALGGNVEPVKVMRSGSNAVDMHIAYYIGRLIEREPDASIHIISGDTDFDPLVEFLKANGVVCKRAKAVSELARRAEPTRQAPPRARATPAASRTPRATPPARKAHSDKMAPIIKQLHSLSGKPATRKKLAQTIANYFRQHREPLADTAVEQIIDDLIRMKYVTQNGTRVSYHLA